MQVYTKNAKILSFRQTKREIAIKHTFLFWCYFKDSQKKTLPLWLAKMKDFLPYQINVRKEIGSWNVEVHWICVIWQKQKYYITFVHGWLAVFYIQYEVSRIKVCFHVEVFILLYWQFWNIAVPYFTCLCSTIAYSRGYVRNSVHETFTKIEVSFFLHAPWIL